MRVGEYAEHMGLKAVTGEVGLDREITGMYVCDLLSWVMSHAGKGDAWVTVLTHLNTVAVAVLTDVACIIVPEDISLEEPTVQKAVQEGIPVLSAGMTTYEICCKSNALGI